MAQHGRTPAATHFLNVDLDVHSKSDLRPFLAALGRKVIVLHTGRTGRMHCAHLELAADPRSADAAIRRFCAAIEALPKPERDLWNGAKVRDFNVGVQAGAQPHSSEFALATETIAATAQLEARIVFTVYAPE